MTRQGLLDAIDELNIWKSGGARAPHKPLLLLLVLGRLRRKQPRLASYAGDIKEPLRKLLRDFGPPHKALHPEYPFWHLQSETGGLWELARHEAPRRGRVQGQCRRSLSRTPRNA